MIPKIIHYCWFGGKPLSPLTLQCIESWKKFLPDYEIIQWNENNYDINKNKFAKSAYESKKYAFVADVCRVEVLYNYGGIYLDTDMEILKPLNDILNDKYNLVLGFENIDFIAVGIIVSSKGNHIMDKLNDFYLIKKFEVSNIYDLTIPKIVTNLLEKQGLKLNNKLQVINESILILPTEYFYPFNYFTKKTNITNNSLALHHYDSSWMDSKGKFKNKVRSLILRILGEDLLNKLRNK